MTDRTAPSPRICPNCDGQAFAAITLGGRDKHGYLRTITVHCPPCHGTGIARRSSLREGARA
ncbi:hypothetical protein ACFZBZ_38180 [Streptomyces sp. NPDC008196]|uniref:hypothetical protein n=1 Tax=Streptomyces sp. NPDC008196 TaxID=3364819 RepID=UPI0036F09C99